MSSTNEITYTREIEAALKKDWLKCSPDAFIGKMKLGQFGNCICEVIPDDVPVKFYGDVDIGMLMDANEKDFYNKDKAGNDKYLMQITHALKAYVLTILNHFLDNPVVAFAEASSNLYWKKVNEERMKYSVRFYVQNYIDTKENQLKMIQVINQYALEQKHYLEKFYDDQGVPYDKENPEKLFDATIYDSHRKMRCVGSSKKGENRPLRLMDDATMEETVISAFIPDDAQKLPVVELPKRETVSVAKPTEKRSYNSSEMSYEFLYVKLALEKGCFTYLADEYKSWMGVLFAFHSCFGKENGLLFAKDFSQLSNKYDETEFCKTWDSIKGSEKPLGFGTLCKCVKDKHMGIHKDIVKLLDIFTVEHTTGSVADYFKVAFGDKFIYCDETLYCFNGVYWKKDDKKQSFLHNFVDGIFHKQVIEVATDKLKYYNHKLVSCNEEDKTEKYKQKIEFIGTKISKFSKDFRNSKSRKEYIDDILKKVVNNDAEFDKKPWLFAFNNRIFDINQKIAVEPNPLDYISLTTGYDYNDNITDTSEVEALYEKILPDPEIRDFNYWIQSTMLSGVLIQKLFIYNGSGGNGKSVMTSLLSSALGRYAYEMPSTCIMQKIKEGANPEVANINCKRGLFMEEPEHDKNIYASTIKTLTGNTNVPVRDLYSSKVGVSNVSTSILACNTKPKMNEVDDAVLRRIEIVPFESKFIDPEIYNNLEVRPKNVFPANYECTTDEFKEKHKQSVIMLLMKKYRGVEVPTVPKKCKDLTACYLQSSDDVFNWFNNTYEKCEGSVLKLTEVFKTYSQSEYYMNLNKKDKRDNNQKAFCELIQKNLFLREYVRLRKDYYNNKQLTSDYIVGWRVIIEEKQNDVKDKTTAI